MHDILQHLFGSVCGQDPGHTWAPGGMLLPFCQRCTGLYVGAFVAAAMQMLLRPVPTNRWLWLNGSLLLLMVPFGFHWLAQGPMLRTATGVLFGFGLVAFLTLTPIGGRHCLRTPNTPDRRQNEYLTYLAGALATFVLVLWLGAAGNSFAADALILLATVGVLILCGLCLTHFALALRWLIRRLVNHPARAPA